MSPDPTFLVVASSNETRERYTRKLESLSVSFSIVESPKELHASTHHTSFHGLMIDVHNFVKLPAECKSIIKDFSQILPTLKLFVANDDFVINYSSFESDNIRDLDDFIRKCMEQPAKALRKNKRHDIYMNGSIAGKRYTITDVSKCGCFILASDLSSTTGEQLEINIKELTDQTPLTAVIRRVVPWGSDYEAAGYGVEFVAMSAAQKQDIDALMVRQVEKLEEAERLLN